MNRPLLSALCFAIMIALASTGVATSAEAQIGREGGPIDVQADETQYLDAQRLARFIGSVTIKQGDNVLLADAVDVFLAEGVDGRPGDVQRIVASGNVYYVTPEEKARSDKGVYNIDTDTIVMTGDVILSRGDESALTGERLVVEPSLGRSTLDGSRKGRQAKSDERVRAVFRTNSDNADAP